MGRVREPDYVSALVDIQRCAPHDLTQLLTTAGRPFGATDVTVYLVDYEQVLLQPILLSLDFADPILPEEDVASSQAGRAFRTGEPVVAPVDGALRVWVPLMEHADRTGALALTVPSVDADVLAACVSLGLFAGLLLRTFSRCSDLVHLRRRRVPMSLAAGMQWDLLPPLTGRSRRGLVCGRLEPAYEIAGDAFDYAINGRHLHAGLFDGIGHGVQSTLLTTLALGAYRDSRRSGDDLADMYAAVDRAVSGQYGPDSFVTGTIAHLDLDTGAMQWTDAGHPPPLLLRAGRVIGELTCAPSLPFGVGGVCEQVATEQLEPKDAVLFYTDGVIEGRDADGHEFGVDRLARLWEREAQSEHPCEEMLRSMIRSVVDYNAGKLRDDSTLLLLRWEGQADE